MSGAAERFLNINIVMPLFFGSKKALISCKENIGWKN
jgi:hypothetical protein